MKLSNLDEREDQGRRDVHAPLPFRVQGLGFRVQFEELGTFRLPSGLWT